MESGLIILWQRSIASIPSGFVLCDGNNDTPDLRNQFVVGAGDSYAVDEVGGSLNHSHTFTGDGHSHTLAPGSDIQSGLDFSTTTSVEPGIGTTGVEPNLPPFYSLAYIMKT